MKKTVLVRIIAFALALFTVCPFIFSCKSGDSGDTTTTTVTTKPKKDYTEFLYSGEKVKLYGDGLEPVIYVDAADYKQSVRAVGDLVKDFERVTGKKPKVVYNEQDLAGTELAIIIGTLGKSSLVTYLESEGYIGLDGIKNQWEAYNISVVENPNENIKKAVVIAGSDKRGTIYGTYELSELIGVSPWYYWGDVEIEHKELIELPVEKLTQTEMPDVKYRGIFINDEENFTEWSSQFISKNSPGKPNPGAYELVFELMLRLRANILWPAMHAASDAFNEYKNPATGISYNAELADDYGIVMSASHCEMLLRNNEGEWVDWCVANEGKYNLTKVNNSWYSSYDYTVNEEAMNAYWEERVAENYLFENIYMIGLRGVHDSGINCSKLSDKSYKGKATVVKKAVEAQLEILAKYEKKYEEVTGEAVKFQTCYCVYKEAAEYFKYDIGLPSDCCLMYAEDNHGYIRSTVSESDKKNYESFGMYYHVSYWGRPASYLWLSNTPLQIMAEEMRKAYYTGTDDIWVLNVGDIKPAEFKMEYFMELGWDVEAHTEHNTEEFSVDFLKQNFGFDDTTSTMFAETLTEFYQLMRSFYPEVIDKHAEKGNYDLSVINYGSEGLVMIDELTEIYDQSLALYNSLPEGKKDSFYELFHYTIYSYLLMIEKHVYQEMNQLCYSQGRFAAANLYADLSEGAYYKVLSEVEYYNKTVAGGKWNKIMNPYNSAVPTPEGAPVVQRASVAVTSAGAGLSVEGQSVLSEAATLYFGSLNDDIRFIDIFNKGAAAEGWALTLPSYVIVKDGEGNVVSGTAQGTNVIYTGSVEIEDRLFLSIDWEVFAAGETKTAEIILTDDHGGRSAASISATKSKVDPSKETKKGYYEENGIVSIEAEHYSENVAQGGFEWKYIDGLGRSGGVMMALSQSDNAFVNDRISSGLPTSSPYLDYHIYFANTGTYKGTFYRLPTLNESASGRSYCSTAWSLDGSTPRHMNGTTTADDADHSAWGNMIKLHIEELAMNVTIKEAGWHTLRIYMVNSLQAFDQIVLKLNDTESRYDAPETFNTIEWTHAEIADLDSAGMTFDDVSWVKYSGLFDFTSSGVQSGYVKVDTSKGSIETNGWEWESTADLNGYFRNDASKAHNLDKGFIASSSDATFRVKVDGAGKYAITVSVGDPTGQVKAENMSISNNGKVCLSSISSSSSGVNYYYFVAEADENGIIELDLSGSWIIGSLDIFTYEEGKSTGDGAFIPNSDGNIVIEVEEALEQSDYAYTTESTDGKGYKWTQVSGQYGGAMVFGPNAGNSYSSTSINSSPTAKMFFTVDIQTTGTYSIWALVKASGDNDDSVIMALDNKQSLTKNDFRETNGYTWVQIGTYSVTKTGETVLTVMGREDGLFIDRIILHPESSPSLNYNGEMVRAEQDAE